MFFSSAFVAIGANLHGPGGRTPLQTCQWAAQRLADSPVLSLQAQSSWFRSAPVPPSGQPDYVNGALRLQTALSPEQVLALLQEIEAEAGRQRSSPNAARTLDLDLLGMDGETRATPRLTLPHPRLHERAFVLVPLVEVAPDWLHPILRRTVRDLAASCDRTGLSPISAGTPPD